MDNIEFNIQDFNENFEDTYMGTDENFKVCVNIKQCVKRKPSNDGCNIQQERVSIIKKIDNEGEREKRKYEHPLKSLRKVSLKYIWGMVLLMRVMSKWLLMQLMRMNQRARRFLK